MMVARGLVLAGLLLAMAAAPAFADSTLTLSSGSTQVAVQGPGINGTVSAAVCSPVNSNWAGAITGTSWISSNANCTADMPAGDYTYTVSFDVPSGATGQQLSGSVMADDSVTVQLNGNTLLVGGGSSSPTPFSTTDTTLFTSGTNNLTFIVHNATAAAPNTTGLDFQATASASGVNVTAVSPNVNANGEGADNDQARSCPTGITTLAQAEDSNAFKNHGEFVSCVAHGEDGGVAPNTSGSGISVSEAAHSDVGKGNHGR